EGAVIAPVRIAIGCPKVTDGLVKGVTVAHVPRQQSGLSRAGMGAGQRPATPHRIVCQVQWLHDLDHGLDLHIAQLPEIEVPSAISLSPAEENVTGGLHQALSDNHSLPPIFEGTFSCVWFEH